MGTNWGAFAGALTNSALSTYERLGEEELRDMQRKKFKKEQEQEAALDTAWRESQARVGQQDEYSQAIKTNAGVGTQQAQALSNQGALAGNSPEDIAFEKASAEAAVGAMRENAAYNKTGNTGYAVPAEGQRAPQAALPEMKPTEYTAKQGMQDYVKAAGQVSRKGTLEAIQLKGVMRESDIQDKFDNEKTKLDDTLARIHGTAETGGLKGLYEAGKKEGLKLNFVEGKNGVGSRIQVLGPKGDVLETVSDVAAATEKLEQAAMKQFYDKSVSLLGSPDKVIAAMQGERKTIAAERTAQADIEYKGKGGVIDRAYSSGARGGSGGKGSANSAENQEKLVTMKAETLMKGQPNRFKDIDQAKAWVVNTAMKGFDTEKNWATERLELVKQGLSPADISKRREAYYAEQGFAPALLVEAARSGVRLDGKPFTDQDKQEFYRRYPNTDIEFGAPQTDKATTTTEAIPSKTYTPPAGSPAARSAEKRQAAIDLAEKDRAAFKESVNEKIAATKSGAFNPASQFEADKGTMTPEALRVKYLPLQRALTPEQFDYLNR